eukprot:TRINITY_DN12610_c0_g1_i12.p1 TRINITY_DN12610_c0_g1~~TRINITY_DN12610_c0_g1_i12.p1  ORF type:complete len:407 (+),score=44.88 TRINITY_DN12610_c0_g1_i12:146-1366(+)
MTTHDEFWYYFFIGVIILFIGLLVLCLYERDYVVRQAQNVIASIEAEEIPNEIIEPSLDSKLVFTNGRLTVGRTLVDPLFGMQANDSLGLWRHVEMLQWEEHKKRHENNRVSYSYSKVWRSNYIVSRNFNNLSYLNPDNLIVHDFKETVGPAEVQFGSFILNQTLLNTLLNDKQTIPILSPPPLSQYLEERCFRSRVFGDMELKDGYLYFIPYGRSRYDVGTLRVSFSRTPAGQVSLCSQQFQNSFKPHNFIQDENSFRSKLLARNIETNSQAFFGLFRCFFINRYDMDVNYERIERGILSKDKFFAKDKMSKKVWRIIILSCCFIALWIGLSFILSHSKLNLRHDFSRISYVLDAFHLSAILLGFSLMVIKYAINPRKAMKWTKPIATFAALLLAELSFVHIILR